MKNKQIAELLYEISELLSLSDGSNHFRVVAYQHASQAVESLPGSIEEIAAAKKLEDVPGIGRSIAEKINEYLSTGRIAYLQELRGQFPSGLIEIMSITGMGPKKAKMIYDRLHVKSVEDLLKAARAQKIRDLPGFGIKTEENILKGIEFKEKSKGRILLFEAILLADEIIGKLKTSKYVRQVNTAGSLRRLERVHGGAVVASECIHKLGWRAGEVEPVRVPRERDVVGWNAGARKSLDHVASIPHVIGLTNPSGGGGV